MSTETDGGASRAAAPKPAFLRELEALRAQRERHTPEREYTIGGSVEQMVHREISESRETRIGHMETRFREIRGHAANEFGVSQVRDTAAREFERSR